MKEIHHVLQGSWTWVRYANWNKTRRQIVHDVNYMRYLEQSSSQIQNDGRRRLRGWVEGDLFNGHRVSVLQNEKSSGDWLYQVNILNIVGVYT